VPKNEWKIHQPKIKETKISRYQWGDWTKWHGQNVTDKMVAISIDFN